MLYLIKYSFYCLKQRNFYQKLNFINYNVKMLKLVYLKSKTLF